MNTSSSAPLARRYGIHVLGAILAGLGYRVLQPFLSPLLWAGLVAYLSWPAYRWLRARLGERRNASALLAVLFLAGAILMPMLWLAVLVKDDLVLLYNAGMAYLRHPQAVPADVLARLPWLGWAPWQFLIQYFPDPQDLLRYLGQIGLPVLRRSIGWLGDIGWNSLKIVFSLMVLFVLYRDGEAVGMQAIKVLRYLVGSRSTAYLDIARKTSRVIVRSTVLAAVLQGLLAGLGYWIVGAGTPALLSIATAIASLIPVLGTALVWGPVGIVLIASGKLWQGLGIFAWGILFVHPIDNIIRPALIGNAARLPFILMIFGIFGGIAAFGLIGVFLGPLVLAIGAAAWRDWVESIPDRTDG